jgi:hypothetical protein
MKFAAARPYADPEAAARKLIEIANSVEAVQDGRIQHRIDQRAVPVRSEGRAGRIQRNRPAPFAGTRQIRPLAEAKQATVKQNLMASAAGRSRVRAVPGRPRHSLQARRPQLTPPELGPFLLRSCSLSHLSSWAGHPHLSSSGSPRRKAHTWISAAMLHSKPVFNGRVERAFRSFS